MRDLFSYAFRPFFILGSFFAVLIVAIWVMQLHSPAGLSPEKIYWHGHEMLVGFAMAAVAGFSLTAIATWTGRPAISGGMLVLLVLAWLAGRVAMGFLPPDAVWLSASVDMLFPLMLCLYVAREIIGAGNQRNLPIVLIVALMAVLNLFFHLGRAGVVAGDDRNALFLLLHLILLLTAIIAGRIVPNFTANWLRQNSTNSGQKLPVSYMPLELLTLALTLATGLCATYLPASELLGWTALAAALAHGIRLYNWRGISTRTNPILFVLHVAYLWFPLGYLITALSQFGFWFPPSVALHALTMGVIGMMILAVASRVALGHTGRQLQVARAVVVAYWLLMLAVLVRLSGAFLTQYMVTVDVSAMLWMAAFAIFAWVYFPVLTGPRADAK